MDIFEDLGFLSLDFNIWDCQYSSRVSLEPKACSDDVMQVRRNETCA